jgi:hypothetical protein
VPSKWTQIGIKAAPLHPPMYNLLLRRRRERSTFIHSYDVSVYG